MLDRLHYFVLVAEHQSFTHAARRAHVSQPALTAGIAKLEMELGARLLDRGPGGASLRAEGRALLPRARAALAAVEDGRRAVREVAGLEAGEVRIGGGATACSYFLPPVLAAFRAAHPSVRLTLREMTSAAVLDDLLAGALDIGVVTTDRGEPWVQDELVLVRAPGIDPKAAPFITFPPGGTTREYLDRYFPGVVIAMEIASIPSIVAHACEGVGMALVSRHAVRRELAAKKLVRVPHPQTPISRPFRLVHRGLERLPPAAAVLRELLLSNRRSSSPSRRTCGRCASTSTRKKPRP
jgi:DNA-binding transcriptional LysR family regulator